MIKVIDLPKAIFLPCALILRDFFVREGYEVIFWSRQEASMDKWFFEKNLDDLYPVFCLGVNDSYLESFIKNKDVEFIVWHHERSYGEGFRLCLKQIDVWSKSLTVSFCPDGVANYASPSPIDETSFSNVISNVCFGSFYVFGRANFQMPDDFCSTPIESVTVPIYSIKECLEPISSLYSKYSDNFWREVHSRCQGLRSQRICFLMLRSWCAGDYGDRYNFGKGAHTLSDIYLDIMNYENVNRSDTVYVIRGDERTQLNHPQLVELIQNKSSKFEVMVFPENYPAFLSMEFFLASIPNALANKINIDLIALDSLSGFFLPFIAENGQVKMGARREFIEGCGASDLQLRQIKGNTRTRIRNIDDAWSAVRKGQFRITEVTDGLFELDYNASGNV